MAITRRAPSAPSDNELDLAVNNGDLDALRDAMNRFGFRDEESVLRFALALLARSATRSFTIVEKDGNTVSLTPSANLLKPAETVSKS